jgi:hypothetical protein
VLGGSTGSDIFNLYVAMQGPLLKRTNKEREISASDTNIILKLEELETYIAKIDSLSRKERAQQFSPMPLLLSTRLQEVKGPLLSINIFLSEPKYHRIKSRTDVKEPGKNPKCQSRKL